MIICPLCNQPVLDDHSADGEQEMVPDHEPWDFRCPKKVQIRKGVWLSHYTRQTWVASPPEYQIAIPPFRITWWDRVNHLQLQKIGVHGDWNRCETIQTWLDGDKSFEDFVELAKRMEQLKAFA